MPSVKVVDMTGKEVGEINLSEKLFGAEVSGRSPCRGQSISAQSETGHTVHSYPHRGFGRRKKALETEGNRTRPSGFDTFSSVDTRRRGSRTEAQRLPRNA